MEKIVINLSNIMPLKEYINNKKIIFCGPLFDKDDKYLEEYDIVVRTNNFFSIEPELRNSSRCNILICNSIFSKRYTHKIVENIDHINYVLSSSPSGSTKIRDALYSAEKKKVHFFSGGNDLRLIKRHPLGLMQFLSYIINNYEPSLFHIDGIDFYMTKDVSKFWLTGYAIKESGNCNVLGRDKTKHDLESNKLYLKRILSKIPYVKIGKMVEEALQVIEEKKVEVKPKKPKKKKKPAKNKFKIPD